MMSDFKEVTDFIKGQFSDQDFIPLHAPRFKGKEREFVMDAIDSTFVSTVGEYVNKFESMMAEISGAKYAIATVNGTSSLHIALVVAGVSSDDEVITQPLTFIATTNAIAYTGARPVFVDVDKDTMGMSPDSLNDFLESHAELKAGICINKDTKRKISACVPMHTFGHACRIDEIQEICRKWNIALIEDSAESLGSYYRGTHTGTFGEMGCFSFNGNKIVTSGGGGALVTNDENLAKKAKHLTTQAKKPHKWEYVHDYVGYNYRMPNLNAAMACAQLEQLTTFIENKRQLAESYKQFFSDHPITFREEPKNCKSNYWLNAVELNDRAERDLFLQYTNDNGVMTRPVWALMSDLDLYKENQVFDIKNSTYLADRIVNIPSSVR
ncbi:MAG: LegC family aminotransferase [Cyclobacteriaceae bacterium]